jgi:hypothetical protein
MKGGAWTVHERGKKCIQNFGYKTWREKHLKGLGVDGKIILNWMLCKHSVGLGSSGSG